jgi:hypothetical protein
MDGYLRPDRSILLFVLERRCRFLGCNRQRCIKLAELVGARNPRCMVIMFFDDGDYWEFEGNADFLDWYLG